MQRVLRSYIVKIGIMDVEKAYKNRISRRLTEILIDAYENRLLDKKEISILATYIRQDFVEKPLDSVEIFQFIEELAHEVPIFASLLADPNSNPNYNKIHVQHRKHPTMYIEHNDNVSQKQEG